MQIRIADQTSCHNPFGGGYTPVQLDYEQVSILMMGELFFVDGGLDVIMIWWEYGVYDMIDDDAQLPRQVRC